MNYVSKIIKSEITGFFLVFMAVKSNKNKCNDTNAYNLRYTINTIVSDY